MHYFLLTKNRGWSFARYAGWLERVLAAAILGVAGRSNPVWSTSAIVSKVRKASTTLCHSPTLRRPNRYPATRQSVRMAAAENRFHTI